MDSFLVLGLPTLLAVPLFLALLRVSPHHRDNRYTGDSLHHRGPLRP